MTPSLTQHGTETRPDDDEGVHSRIATMLDGVDAGTFLPDAALVDAVIADLADRQSRGAPITENGLTAARRFFTSIETSAAQRHVAAALLRESPIQPSVRPHAAVTTISVVTPSFNQAEFLSACLRSVQVQSVAPLEHFVLDPGSSDGSRELAATFPHVTLIAEPDDGQSDALNKGFKLASGDVIAWVNSDDAYAHSTVFARVVERFNAADAPDVVFGRGTFIGENGATLRTAYTNRDPNTLRRRLQHEIGILQPTAFFRRRVIERVGGLRNDRHFTMDYDFWIRCAEAGLRFAFVDETFALAHYYTGNKTFGQREASYAEMCEVSLEHYGYVHHTWLRRFAEFNTAGHDGVLSTAAGNGTIANDALEREHQRLIVAYNGAYDQRALLERLRTLAGCGETLAQLERAGTDAVAPCTVISSDATCPPGRDCRLVGQRRFAFERSWKVDQLAKSRAFFERQVSTRTSDVCVVVGNGPSLRQIDLALLQGHDVIVCNNAFVSDELMRVATYYTVVNYLVAEQGAAQINRLERVHRVVPEWLSYCVNPGDHTHYVVANALPEFSTGIAENISWRHTVTFFNLQLAYGLGYGRVVLIGVDNSYRQPVGVTEGDIIHEQGADENHFSPAYFRGKRWQAADVAGMEEVYVLAKAAFEADGREIVNATVGGALELFRRVELELALDGR